MPSWSIDPIDDPDPDGDWVLDGVVVVVLGHCHVVVIVFLVDERDGDGVGGVEVGANGDAPVVFAENNALNGDDFCSSCAGCL